MMRLKVTFSLGSEMLCKQEDIKNLFPPISNQHIQFLAAEVAKNSTNILRAVQRPKKMQLQCSLSFLSAKAPLCHLDAHLNMWMQTPIPLDGRLQPSSAPCPLPENRQACMGQH